MTAGRRTLTAIVALLAAALLSLAAIAQQAAQNPRIALVVGNATYRDAALATTANDAGLVAQTLQAAGFDVVGARDLDGQSLRTAFRDFLDKASAAGPDMQAFVYLAGRGVQYDGDNYFVPVDAQINRDADVPIDALRISDFAHALAQRPGKARIIVLDAARANPYAPQGSPLAPGLALVDPEPGQLMAFNAAPGTLAGDEQGPYGVFGKTLAGAMRQGGVDVAEVFDRTRVTVNQLTQGALLPWSASKLTEPYYIFERAADAPPPAAPVAANQSIAGLPADAAYAAALQRDTIRGYEEYLSNFPNSAQAPRVRAILAALREAYFWRRSVNANTAHAYWTYLRRYPKGPHLDDARRRLQMISAPYEPPPDFRPMTYQDLPPPPQDEDFYEAQPVYAFDAFGPPPPPPPPQYYYVEDDDWRDLPPPPPPVDVGLLPVLAIGIPLVVGAVAFQNYDHYHRDGVAPAGLSPFRPPPPAPPPLPRNVKPVQPPPPVPVRVTGPVGGRVKPLPPIGPPAAQAAKPAAGPAPAPSPGGKTPAEAPAVTGLPGGKSVPAPPVVPATGGKPPTLAPVAPALGKSPTPPAAPAASPGAPVAAPGGKPPAGVTAPPGGKPLQVAPGAPASGGKPPGKPTTVTPGAPAALPDAPVATPSGKAPATVAAPPGAKPLPVAPNIATPSTSVPATPLSGKAPISVVTPPTEATPPASTLIAPPPAKPSPAPPPPAAKTPNTIVKPLSKPAGPAPVGGVNLAPKPAVNPPPITPAALPKAAPAIVHPPSPAPPLVHAPPPPPVVRPPPPIVHATPPAHVVRAPSPPPVVHAPAAPLPVVHAPPPAAQHPPICGNPGLPPCPK